MSFLLRNVSSQLYVSTYVLSEHDSLQVKVFLRRHKRDRWVDAYIALRGRCSPSVSFEISRSDSYDSNDDFGSLPGADEKFVSIMFSWIDLLDVIMFS